MAAFVISIEYTIKERVAWLWPLDADKQRSYWRTLGKGRIQAENLMNRHIFSLIILTTLCCFASVANSKELVREFKGTGDTLTDEFEVEAPWIVDWRSSGDYPGNMALQVNLVRSPGGEYLGKVTSTKWVSNGVKLFQEGGLYRLQVNSSLANWTLRVEQLTKAEAETYTPKNQD